MEIRHIFVGGRSLMYKWYRKDTKHMYAKVNKENDVIVSTPYFISGNQVDNFMIDHYEAFANYLDKRENEALINIAANKLSIHGVPHEIKIILTNGKQKYELLNNNIYLHLNDEENKKKMLKKLLLKEGEAFLIARTKKFIRKYHFETGTIEVKWMANKWGQCERTSRNITLASQLFAFNDELIDYVILHELTHTIHPNHSLAFWKQLEEYYPKYIWAKEKLKFEC